MTQRETIQVQTQPCIVCGKVGYVTVNVDGYYHWATGTVNIQNALPELTPGEREQILNGTHDECFEKLHRGLE